MPFPEVVFNLPYPAVRPERGMSHPSGDNIDLRTFFNSVKGRRLNQHFAEEEY